MKKILSAIVVLVMLAGVFSGSVTATDLSATSNEGSVSLLVGTTRIETDFIRNSDCQKDSSGVFTFTRSTCSPSLTRANQTEYIQEQIAFIPLSEEDAQKLEREIAQVRAGGGSVEKYTDLTAGVTAYSTVTYAEGNSDGKTTTWLTKVEGHYVLNQNTNIVKSQTLTIGQTGLSPTGILTQSKTYYPYSNYWSTYPPDSWQPIFAVSAATNVMGANYTLQCSNEGKTFTVELSNNVNMSQ